MLHPDSGQAASTKFGVRRLHVSAFGIRTGGRACVSGLATMATAQEALRAGMTQHGSRWFSVIHVPTCGTLR